LRIPDHGVSGAYLIRKNQEESLAYQATRNKRWWIYLSANDPATGSDVRWRQTSPKCKLDCGVVKNPELQSETGKLDTRLSSTEIVALEDELTRQQTPHRRSAMVSIRIERER
jgi:hypothetical protein